MEEGTGLDCDPILVPIHNEAGVSHWTLSVMVSELAFCTQLTTLVKKKHNRILEQENIGLTSFGENFRQSLVE